MSKSPAYSILLLGLETAVSRAMQQIFGPEIKCHYVPVSADDHVAVLKQLDDVFSQKDDGPVVTVTSDTVAWRATRVLNTARRGACVFSCQINQVPPRTLRVVPACGLPHDCLFSHFAAGDFNSDNWLKMFISSIRKIEGIGLDELKQAIVHHAMAVARHRLPVVASTGGHGRSDVHAAIRMIQGAALVGSITPDVAMAACSSVLDLAKVNNLLVEERSREKKLLNLFQSVCPAAVSHQNGDPFASLLVVDDQGFWGTPMMEIWAPFGLKVLHKGNAEEAVKQLAMNPDPPVRAVLLDMQLKGNPHAGAKVLQELCAGGGSPKTPVIVFSVDDQHSETVLLKRMGAFAYLNKHALAEFEPGRDAVSAFCQIRDAVQSSIFASLAEDIGDLCGHIVSAYGKMLTQEPRPNGVSKEDVESLAKYMANLAYVYFEELRRVFHGQWQDSGYPSGLAFRQIIRAWGIVNDNWCSFWKRFCEDPDIVPGPLSFTKPPYFAYHLVATSIRGEAAHGMLNDDAFTWLDLWIMTLAMLLKLDGTWRRFLLCKKGEIPEYGQVSDSFLHRITQALLGLSLCVPDSKCELNDMAMGDDAAQLETSFVQQVDLLRKRIKNSIRLQGEEVDKDGPFFQQGDPRRLSFQPYASRWEKYYDVVGSILTEGGCPSGLSIEQLRANLVTLRMMYARLMMSFSMG